jgi:hypothetical protein
MGFFLVTGPPKLTFLFFLLFLKSPISQRFLFIKNLTTCLSFLVQLSFAETSTSSGASIGNSIFIKTSISTFASSSLGAIKLIAFPVLSARVLPYGACIILASPAFQS